MSFIDITISGTNGKGGLMEWEGGAIPWLYLDSHRNGQGAPAPLATVGIGCAVVLADALALPFQIQGTPATAAQIEADFQTVMKAPFGYVAGYYARFTTCRLSVAAMQELCETRLAIFVRALESIFPNFNTWPDGPKAATLDLIYGTGVAGFMQYHHFIAACKAMDWKTAAAQSGADTTVKAYKARNQARMELFLAAAGYPANFNPGT